MSSKWYLVPLPLLFACGLGNIRSDGDLYRQAEALRRRGLTLQAIEVADRGYRRWQNRPTSEWHWKFRLLQAELLNQGSPARALELLQGGGGSPPTSELDARYRADLGYSTRDGAMLDQAADLASRGGHSSLLATIEWKR